MKRSLLIWILGLFLPLTCAGQIWTVQTNVLDWAALGTANAEIGMSVSQHFSLVVGGRYNPWEFTDSKYNIPIRNQQQTAYLGVRFWPWYVNSGFWISAKAQYMFSFSNTGIWRAALKEGKNGIGGALAAGYTFMLSKHFNLEAGIGGWAGVFKEYGFYSSHNKYEVREEGRKTFIYPDQVSLSLVYVF
ncbi:MAG: DUF3575 domain-containing protein [Bacteroidales bacterium]|nr:DUF3575 domain-containing protein [Bacteroidales bacterium]